MLNRGIIMSGDSYGGKINMITLDLNHAFLKEDVKAYQNKFALLMKLYKMVLVRVTTLSVG